ncbi:protein of unknown function [Bacillus velezensis UCMB5033]|nr:protein of unknown function [Bacillus velezensis UCMB5113]CDG28480.1 protein of unknown function [Bacillus velezensis UCMB5033]
MSKPLVSLGCGREDLNLHGLFTRWALNKVILYYELQKPIISAFVYFDYECLLRFIFIWE